MQITEMLYLLCNLTQEAGLETVLRAAFSVQFEAPRHPHPEGPATLTRSKRVDAHTQLEAARKDKHLTRLLKGVVTNMR